MADNPNSRVIPGTGVELELVLGDITAQDDLDVVVNAANAQLMPGGGVAGAIHAAAGPGLAAECRPLAPIKPGDAVITGAHKLPNRYVIHCLGPVYGVDQPEARLLAACYRGALNLAETNGTGSIAFPAISTGVFGYPIMEAARVSLEVIRDFNAYKSLEKVRIVIWDERDINAFREVMKDIFSIRRDG